MSHQVNQLFNWELLRKELPQRQLEVLKTIDNLYARFGKPVTLYDIAHAMEVPIHTISGRVTEKAKVIYDKNGKVKMITKGGLLAQGYIVEAGTTHERYALLLRYPDIHQRNNRAKYNFTLYKPNDGRLF